MATREGEGDHTDIARNNTGFIRALRIADEGDGSKLQAAFDFTEPEVKEKVKRGTIPNTSAGIMYDFMRKADGKVFPVSLAHVALTHRPWIDGLEPFGIAAADGSAVALRFSDRALGGRASSDADSLADRVSAAKEALYGARTVEGEPAFLANDREGLTFSQRDRLERPFAERLIEAREALAGDIGPQKFRPGQPDQTERPSGYLTKAEVSTQLGIPEDAVTRKLRFHPDVDVSVNENGDLVFDISTLPPNAMGSSIRG